jgi:hypothetical protein
MAASLSFHCVPDAGELAVTQLAPRPKIGFAELAHAFGTPWRRSWPGVLPHAP